ncbi:S-adenosyl-L-methionine-dependent methyltransferase, partial [Mycena sanguinolenta]
ELDLGEDSSEPEGTIHIRRINHFCIFEGEEMVPAVELLGDITSHEFTAMGLVKPQLLNSATDDDDDEAAQFVNDLRITELDVHHIDADGNLDPNIYIKTARAWYILETPAPTYQQHFIPLQIQHSLTNDIALAALRNAKTTYKKFTKSLDPSTRKHLETIEVVSVRYFQLYIVVIAKDVKNTTERDINNVPLVKTLLKRGCCEHLEIEPPEVKAFVTPVVGRIVMPYVPCAILGSNSAGLTQVSVDESPGNLPERDHDDPTSMRWGHRLSHGYYDSVEVDGIIYKQGDIIAVKPGLDDDDERAERATLSAEFCRNSYARHAWFIKIQYFFDDDKEKDDQDEPAKKLHGQWFAHGSDTILAEVNHSQELFLLEQCNDIHISSIYRKCAVRKLEAGEPEIPDKGEDTTTYFYRYLWGTEEYDFRDPPTDEEQRRVISLLPEHMPCVNCGFEAEEALHRQLHPLGPEVPNGFTQFGYEYHQGDFVFVKPERPEPPEPLVPTPLFIGQIIAIDGLAGELDENRIVCSIQYFKRYPEDERRLYRTRKANQVKAKDLDGVCWVKFIDQADGDEIEDWINADSVLYRFYTNTRESSSGDHVPLTKADFDGRACEPCTEKHELDSEQYHLRNGTKPITCLDVFSGAGGLSAGLNRSGYFEAKWGIEHSPSAAKTFTVNHPNTKVLCADVNDVLKYIVDREEGKNPTLPRSLDGSPMSDSDIPRPGEVDFVGGGSPCQPFSGANFYRFQKFDVRTTLPYTMLGLVEALRPKFVLFENVTGFLSYYLAGDGLPGGKRVEMAALKLFCRVLMALGYQVRFKVLQAGQYGAPQDRERIIFLGAMRGHKLPEFPIPTHAFKPARRFKIPLRRKDRIRPPTCSRTDEDHLYAPHPAVTVNDAIDDTVRKISPHCLIPQTLQDVDERKEREGKGIRQCAVTKIPVGFPVAVPFAREPRTRFQKMMRRQDGLIEDHVTQVFKDSIVELTTLVPLRAWSNHSFLPQIFLPAVMKRPNDTSTYRDFFLALPDQLFSGIFYGRLDGAGYFKTALTEPRPTRKKSYFIHPTYKRTLTLREFARSQGFPDSYAFRSTESTPTAELKEYFKQVGNAVPLALAAALGRSIGAAAVHDWRQRNRRE